MKRRSDVPAAALAAAVSLWLCVAPGCKSSSSSTDVSDEKPAAAAIAAADKPARKAKARPARPVNLALNPPAVLADENVKVQARTGIELQKASLPFDKVLEGLPVPQYLKPAAEAPKPAAIKPPLLPGKVAEAQKAKEAAEALAAQDGEDPPAAALRAYALGRAAYLEGNRFEAVNQLEQAHRLDPNSAQVLRLLGTVYFAKGDDVRGAQRLAEAVKLQASDSESLFLLGRFAFHKARWDEAIVTLARAMGVADAADADPAVEYLGPYYLGQALLQSGYDAAAIDKLDKYLRLPGTLTRTTRLHRELAFLDRQMGMVHLQVADALCRLGRFSDALTHYVEAGKDEDGLVDPQLLAARRVYALLVLGRVDEAERLVVEALRSSASAPQTLKLVGYVAENGGDRAQFVRLVQSVYEQTDRPSTLALAVVELLPREKAAAFLADHLAARPSDMAVYSRLVASLGQEDPSKLVSTVVALIRNRPAAAPRYVAELKTQKVIAPDKLLTTLDALPKDQAESAAAWYIRGALHEAAGRLDQAAESYDKAFTIDPKFVTPQLATIELQLRLRRYDKALELVEKMKDGSEPEVRFAKAQALAGLNRADEAAAVLETLLNEQPKTAKYLLFQARLQVMKRDFATAEKTLFAILDFEPTSEAAFAALFELYENDPRTDQVQWLRLMKRVQSEMPASRIARLKMAEYYAAQRQFDRAEQSLRSLLLENPADVEALSKLIAVLGRADRWADAEKVLLDQIDKRPDDAVPLLLLEDVAGRLQHAEVYYTKKENFLTRQKPSLEKFYELARLYIQWKKPDKAVAALEAAVKLDPKIAKDIRPDMARLYQQAGRNEEALAQLDTAIKEQPDKAADLLYIKALIYHETQDQPNAEKTLLEALKLDPDHAPSNNDLGYLWAEEGKNLDKALEMTAKAVAAEPDKGEYLDSLGWCYYKLSRFAEAVDALEKARTKPTGGDPIILDHLGDALWRLGREASALNIWQGAMRAAEQLRGKERPELEKVRASVADKIRAVQAKEKPAVAPVGPLTGAAIKPAAIKPE